MAAEGLDTPDGFVRDATNNFGGGAGALRELTSLPVRPTAIIASTDVLAIGALHAASQLGIAVPAEVSIVGFDDLPQAEYTTPTLTTARMPIAKMAAAAVRAAIDGGWGDETTILEILQPAIVIRESSGRPPDDSR